MIEEQRPNVQIETDQNNCQHFWKKMILKQGVKV